MRVHVSILLQPPLPARLAHHPEQGSLCCTAAPCWFSLLNRAVEHSFASEVDVFPWAIATMILHHEPLKSPWQTPVNICSYSCIHRKLENRLARLQAVGCVQTCCMCLSSLNQRLPEAGSCGKKQEMRWRTKPPLHIPLAKRSD